MPNPASSIRAQIIDYIKVICRRELSWTDKAIFSKKIINKRSQSRYGLKIPKLRYNHNEFNRNLIL